MNLPALKINFTEGQYFRHIDGGYYQFEKSVLFADDKDELVIYKHMWPFETSVWARRADEFLARFTPISQEEFEQAKQMNQAQLQQQIAQSRQARRQSQ